jgi:predicted transcriptional regulator
MAASTTLRLPEALKADADAYASQVGVSLNALCLIALRDYLDARAGTAPVRSGLREAASPPAAPAVPAQSAGAEEARRAMARAQERSVLVPRVGANQPCPCGSGEKYKRCHGRP